MPKFIEKSCVFEHGDRKFESGGAYNTGKTMIAYLKIQDGVTGLTDWHGNVLTTEVRIISARKLTGYMSDKLLYLRFRYDGKIWSGTSMGNGMAVKAKLTKLKKL